MKTENKTVTRIVINKDGKKKKGNLFFRETDDLAYSVYTAGNGGLDRLLWYWFALKCLYGIMRCLLDSGC